MRTQLSLPHRHTFPLHDVRFFRTSADHTTWRRQTGIPDWLLDTPPRAYKAACGEWWRQPGSNRRPHACKARALPTELCPRWVYVRAEGSQGRMAVRADARGSLRRRTSPPALEATMTMVGLGRLERPTSPLSGVRSNHLSYRPVAGSDARASPPACPDEKEKRGRRRPANGS